ncbi:MAG: hypothetical protein WD023_05315 [Ilumatobacteraceae bacterium]
MYAIVAAIVEHVETLEVRRSPTISAAWWITDDAGAANLEQPGCGIDDDHRGSETSCGHDINGPEDASGDHGLHIIGNDIDPTNNVKRTDAVAKQIGTLLAPLDQGEERIRSIDGDHQTGEPAAGAEIDDVEVDPGNRFGQYGNESPSVSNGRINRPTADRAAALDLGENSGERTVVSHSPER